jgi:phospholipid-binding lipoprotein MlaA
MRKNGLFILLLSTACSTTPDNPDPHEGFNRDMTEFNLTVDKNVLKPTATAYKEVSSDGARLSVSNFLANLREPFYFINYLATLNGEYAANSLFRFVINSTFGILGLFDVGAEIGLERNETSHKSSLKKWGVPTGDYLTLPIFGPSSTRDAIAEPISWFADPVSYFIGFPWAVAKFVASAVSDRAEHDKFVDSIQDSMDPYSTMKSMYRQKYGNESENDEDSEEDSSTD